MNAQLTPSWRLTDEHAGSSHAVLLHWATGEAFGPADIVVCYPSWGYLPARLAVERMAKTRHLTPEGHAAVSAFCA